MTKRLQERDKGAVAIVGMAGRFPGAQSTLQFWQNLARGVESIRFTPEEELRAAGVDPDLIANPDYVRASSTIDEPEYFDASFFGFSAREAEIIDPQQRVFLECAWEALEDAAYDPGRLAGRIGVFAGTGMNLYGAVNLSTNPDIVASAGTYQIMVGNDKDFLCSRVSYKLNLRGPAVGVQTACSTSLVAVQMAFESLLRNECDMALAGGVSIPVPQPVGYLYVPGMILSRDGHCRAFDAEASGTVPGAGAGVVVLKCLERALSDGDHIYAVIRGAAINNDGAAKVGYSAPGVEGQAEAIRRSMQMADFEPDSVSYIEAHGTGTEVGDPIEIAALSKAFETVENRRSCAIGAVKTNIGHLDAAAGVAGLIKTALSIHHKAIPPTLHFTKENPLIDFAKTPFYVNATFSKYEKPGPFRAGVSSFGIGGTNAHVSLEEAPQIASDPAKGSQLILLSAKTATALDKQSERLAAFLEENPATNLADLAYTLQTGRQVFQHRRVLLAGDREELLDGLRGANTQSAGQRQLRSADVPTRSSGVAFLFPGQGSQYVNMGIGLYETMPVFRSAIDRCCEILEPHLGLDLRKIFYPGDGEEARAQQLLSQTAYTQPAIFVIEYAMANLWMDCGIQPSAMIGHSVGEYVAACIAGVFSLEDALALIAARGRMVQAVPAGAMLAVNLSEQDLEPLISPGMSIAAVNSPRQSVASGPGAAIDALEATLKAKKIDCRRLRTSHAFHSPMMDAVVREFTEEVAKIELQVPKLRYLSNVTGKWITDAQAASPEYWGRHLRSAVRFADSGRNLLREFSGVVLEVGPGDTLLSLLRSQPEAPNPRLLVSSMPHPAARESDRDFWLMAAGRLWLSNIELSWDALHRGERRVRLSLPTYPFERQRYWIEPGKAQSTAQPAMLERKPDIADWFYVPSWKRGVPELLASKANETSVWLVLADDGDFANNLADDLGAIGRVVRVRAAARYRHSSSNEYELNPANRDEYLELIRDLESDGMWPGRIVHAWMPNGDLAQASDALDRGPIGIMLLLQAMEECQPGRPYELNVIGDRIHSVSGEPVCSPAIQAEIAFSRVAALECPNISYRAIDVDLNADKGFVRKQVVTELRSAASNEVVAYRGKARWIQQYEPVPLESVSGDASINDSRTPLTTAGTYLITGGTGGIGLVLARHLAERAQARVVLTSRTPFPDASKWDDLLELPQTPESIRRKIEGLRAIEAAGGKVAVLEADAGDSAAMQRILLTVRKRFGPIHGIIHAAGVPGNGMVQAKSREEAIAVLAPKTRATEWIRECLGDKDLKFVLLCSSINAVLPSFGLSDYAAANAYLDAFASVYDDPLGTRVISINWDTWREVGMAVETHVPTEWTRTYEDRLKHGILSAEGREIFDRVLNFPLPQVLISTISFDQLQKQVSIWAAERRKALLSATDNRSAQSEWTGVPVSETEVEQFIVAVWQELLGVPSIQVHDDFFKLGGHSLVGTQMLARVRERFKVDISLRTIFEASTPAALAQHVRTLAGERGAPVSVTQEREEIEI